MKNSGGVEVLEDGSVIEYGGDNAEEVRGQRANFAAFKFSLLETLAADPKKPSHMCVSIMIAFCNFADRENRQAYCSISSLMIRADIASKQTVILNRDWLVAQKYLVKVEGAHGPNGETIYRLENPRLLDVRDHVTEACIKRNEDVARQKREYRKRMAVSIGRGTQTEHPEIEQGYSSCTDRGTATVPNTLEEPVNGYCYEGGSKYPAIGNTNAYAVKKAGEDPNPPYAVPADEKEAEKVLDQICGGRSIRPITRETLKGILMDGRLTPGRAFLVIDGKERVAA